MVCIMYVTNALNDIIKVPKNLQLSLILYPVNNNLSIIHSAQQLCIQQ